MNELRNTQIKELIPAAIYLRYSCRQQKSVSLAIQEEKIRAWANVNGYKVVATYQDAEKSGTNTEKRDGFQRMMQDSSGGIFKAIIVAAIDRFSRSVADTEAALKVLKDNGVELLSVSEDIASSKIARLVHEGEAEQFIDKLSQRVFDGHMKKAEKMKHNGGTPPLGYDIDHNTDKMTVNENEAEAVRLIFDLYLQDKGYSEIAERLNEKGFKTKAGKPFAKNSFFDILRNKKYAGYYIYNKTAKASSKGVRNKHKYKNEKDVVCIKDESLEIISEETFNKAQEKMDSRQRAAGSYKATHNYLLSGLIKCGECGRSMHGSSRKSGNGYYTYSYRCAHNKLTCKNREIGQEQIETYVLNIISRIIFTDENIPVMIDDVKSAFASEKHAETDEIKRIDNVIRGHKKSLDNLINAIMKGFAEDVLKAKMDQLTNDIKILEDAKSRIDPVKTIPEITEQMINEIVLGFPEKVRASGSVNGRNLVYSLIDSVVVFKDRVEIKLKLPEDSQELTFSHTEGS